MKNTAEVFKEVKEEVKGYQPKMPEIIKMTESICSMKVKDMLKEAGAEYMFVQKEAFHMVGRRCVTPDGGGAWGVARADGTIKRMEAYLEWDNENDRCSVEICIPYVER